VKKKIDPREALRFQLYNNAPVISESYPNVKTISIKKTFFDDSGNKKLGDEKIWDVPLTARLYFYIDCPQHCIDGGYDLTAQIIEMLSKNKNNLVSEQICQGWQDEERRNKFHCLTTFKYEINIEYSFNK